MCTFHFSAPQGFETRGTYISKADSTMYRMRNALYRPTDLTYRPDISSIENKLGIPEGLLDSYLNSDTSTLEPPDDIIDRKKRHADDMVGSVKRRDFENLVRSDDKPNIRVREKRELSLGSEMSDEFVDVSVGREKRDAEEGAASSEEIVHRQKRQLADYEGLGDYKGLCSCNYRKLLHCGCISLLLPRLPKLPN